MSGAVMRAAIAASVMALVAVGAAMVRPAPAAPAAPAALGALLPEAFGEWRETPALLVVAPQEGAATGETTVYRAYEDRFGRVVTLVIAYGPPQSDAVRLHRPETCYVAQGYAIEEKRVARIGPRALPAVELRAASPSRREAVSYLLRDGPAFTTAPGQSQANILRGTRAARADGLLLRVSSLGGEETQFALNRRFIEDFTAAASPDLARLLYGGDGQ